MKYTKPKFNSSWYKAGQKRPEMAGENNPSKRPDIALKISNSKKGKPRIDIRKEKCHFWRGGISKINTNIRNSLEYAIWRRSIFERDNYICIWCGKRGGTLHADHIKPFALYPELRFAIDNGRTLCIECHKKTDTYLKNNKKYEE